MRVVMIGMGGVGSILLIMIAQYLNTLDEEVKLILIDGDSYEQKNAKRQIFHRLGNKAEVQRQDYMERFPQLKIDAKPYYVNADNLYLFLENGDYVFMMVDNYPTRKMVSDYCKTLSDVVMFSGGNDLTDGDTSVSVRVSGKDVTPPLDFIAPEIANPQGKHPDEMSCEELASSGTLQIMPTNAMVAVNMFCDFWYFTTQFPTQDTKYHEKRFSLMNGRTEIYDRRKLYHIMKKQEGR